LLIETFLATTATKIQHSSDNDYVYTSHSSLRGFSAIPEILVHSISQSLQSTRIQPSNYILIRISPIADAGGTDDFNKENCHLWALLECMGENLTVINNSVEILMIAALRRAQLLG